MLKHLAYSERQLAMNNAIGINRPRVLPKNGIKTSLKGEIDR
jgi:hypothetical protein